MTLQREWQQLSTGSLPVASFSLSSLVTPFITTMEDFPTPLRCFNECHAGEKFVDDGVESVTSVEQVSGGRD